MVPKTIVISTSLWVQIKILSCNKTEEQFEEPLWTYGAPEKLLFWGAEPSTDKRKMLQDIGAIKVDKVKPVPKTIVISTSLWVQNWRRERDSNPWCDFSHTAFPGLHLKPLGHLCIGLRT